MLFTFFLTQVHTATEQCLGLLHNTDMSISAICWQDTHKRSEHRLSLLIISAILSIFPLSFLLTVHILNLYEIALILESIIPKASKNIEEAIWEYWQ